MEVNISSSMDFFEETIICSYCETENEVHCCREQNTNGEVYTYILKEYECCTNCGENLSEEI